MEASLHNPHLRRPDPAQALRLHPLLPHPTSTASKNGSRGCHLVTESVTSHPYSWTPLTCSETQSSPSPTPCHHHMACVPINKSLAGTASDTAPYCHGTCYCRGPSQSMSSPLPAPSAPSLSSLMSIATAVQGEHAAEFPAGPLPPGGTIPAPASCCAWAQSHCARACCWARACARYQLATVWCHTAAAWRRRASGTCACC